ncbi:MAG: hypothetical protein APF77_09385 [Clostridia bacterium BRH_c25]|nr:MAG: hypothetical protein APF77_09385 [Clostridia bacterium BRH_c25]
MDKPDCKLYEGGEIPPCSAFLNNANPIIKDGKLIYRNENRVYYFISAAPASNDNEGYPSSITNAPAITSNIQISLSTFIIGLFINQIQLEVITYDKNCSIHSDQTVNTFIHEAMQNSKEIEFDFIPTLTFTISNTNAILPLYSYTLNITSRNYLILFILNRLEGNPGLFFGNNSFAAEDDINYALSALNIQFPIKPQIPVKLKFPFRTPKKFP